MTDTPRIRPFADFLREHGRGRTHDERGAGHRHRGACPTPADRRAHATPEPEEYQ